MKWIALYVLRFSGLAWLSRRAQRNKLTILLYHGVAPAAEESGIYNYRHKFITPSAFDDQMAYIGQRYSVLPLDEAFRRLQAGTLPPYALAITFDDGYRNNYMHAYPILKKYGFTATFFLATDFVFKKSPLWVDRLEYAMGRTTGTRDERIARDITLREELKKIPENKKLERIESFERTSNVSFPDFLGERGVYAPLETEDIAQMREGGMTFGAHTQSHPILSMIGPSDMQKEIEGSRDAVKTTCGTISNIFAYPNGQRNDWTEETERIVKDAGFEAALTTIDGSNTNTTHAYRLQRTVLDNTDDTTAFVVRISGIRAKLRSLLNRSR